MSFKLLVLLMLFPFRGGNKGALKLWMSFLMVVVGSTALASFGGANHFQMDGLNNNEGLLGEDKLGEMGTRSLFYLNDQYQNPEARSVQLFEGRIIRRADESDFSLGIDLEGQFSITQRWFNSFTANEFYFRMDPLWTGTTLYLGRKRTHWSNLDERWKLGVWQPVFRVDALDPHSQGLTGLFVVVKNQDWTLEFFGTPFFLPDHGPQVETRDGAFVKGHPWIQYPPSEVVLKGEVTPAFYRIDKPSIPDVIVNTGYGFNLQVGAPENGGWVSRLSWIYKPMNQLLLGFDGNLSVANTERLEIDIHPEVGFHEVASLDGAYYGENWRVYAGSILDRPMEMPFESPWTYQNFAPSHILGAGAEVGNDQLHFGVGVLHRNGGEQMMKGPHAAEARNVLPERFLFRDLVKAELGVRRKLRGPWTYEVHGEWRQELEEGSEILSARGALSIGSFWKVYMGTDLLRSDNKVPGRFDFIESYQANDRVYGGLQYVF